MHDHHESQRWHVACLHPDPLILSQHLASATSLYLYPAPQCQQSIQHQQTLSQQVETIISIYYLYYLSSTLSTSITYMTPSLPRSSKAVSKAAVSCICTISTSDSVFWRLLLLNIYLSVILSSILELIFLVASIRPDWCGVLRNCGGGRRQECRWRGVPWVVQGHVAWGVSCSYIYTSTEHRLSLDIDIWFLLLNPINEDIYFLSGS